MHYVPILQAGVHEVWVDTSDEEGYEATPDKWGLGYHESSDEEGATEVRIN